MDGIEFGHYRLLELLGRGGMGEVYRAYDTTTDRVVAVKLLPAGLAQDEAYQARFRREAHAAAQLNDPHIIPIHRYGEIDGRLYLDMRIVEGTDLGHILANSPGGIAPTRAVGLIRQVATALDAAHRMGLVHRDIKPSNILVTANGFAYLIDFGIARAVEQTALTGTGATVGTFAYMAPERLRTGVADTRSDIYALTCVLYECLTGARAFDGEGVEQLITSHLFTPPPRPTALNPRLPAAFDQVVAIGLAKEPDQRYQSVLQLADAAEAALGTHSPEAPTAAVPPSGVQGPPVVYPRTETAAPAGTPPPFHAASTQHRPAYPTAPAYPAASAAPARPKGRRTTALTAGAVALALLAVVGLIVWQVRPDRPDPAPDSRSGSAAPPTAATGTIEIGVKFDQPGLGLREADGTMTGFDVDVATFLAGDLGYAPDQIDWKEAPSGQRESMIANGQVQFVVATYTITDARKQKVDFAGPYLVGGQSLLVRADESGITSKATLTDRKLCSVTGSTPAQRIKDEFPGVQLQQYDTYSACIEALRSGLIDAVTTDDVILAGYAAQSPGTFKLVGGTFSEERYGIGLTLGDNDLRRKLNDALKKMESEGAWGSAFEQHFGPAGLPTPSPPPIDP